jgi:hypothetical protein
VRAERRLFKPRALLDLQLKKLKAASAELGRTAKQKGGPKGPPLREVVD